MVNVIDEAVNDVIKRNVIIKEKELLIEKLTKDEEDLTQRISKAKTYAEQLERENNKTKWNIGLLSDKSIKEIKANNDSIAQKFKELEERKKEIDSEAQLLEDKRAGVQKLLSDNDVKIAEARELDAQIEAKRIESKKLSEAKATELKKIQDETLELKIENNKNTVLKNNIQEANEENNRVLARIQEAQKDNKEQFDTLHGERQANELLRVNAIKAVESMDFKENILKNAVTTFRQALHTYIQLAWTDAKIDTLTREDIEVYIETLKAHIEEYSSKPAEIKEIEPIKDEEPVKVIETPVIDENKVEIKKLVKAIKMAENETELNALLETYTEEEKLIPEVVEAIDFVKWIFNK